MLTVLAWSIFFPVVSAQRPQLQPTFRHYAVEDGLPSSEVYHCMQDSKGYLWFATDRGVSRYDGYAFENFGIADGLPDNTVFNIFEDYKGRIWFTSISAQLAYYENGMMNQYKYNNLILEKVRTLYKSPFYVDRKDNVYCSVFAQGYMVITDSGEITQYACGDSSVYHIDQVDSTTFFLSSWLGMAQQQPIIQVRTERYNTVVRLNKVLDQKNSSCIQRSDGSLLFSGWNELIEIKSADTIIRHALKYPSIALYEDQQENIWLGTFEHGVEFHSSGPISQPTRTYLQEYSVTSIMQDREGAYWFTTLEDGVFYRPPNEMLTYDKFSESTQSQMGALTSDGNKTLFAAHQSGVVHMINDTLFRTINLPSVLNTRLYVNALMYEKEQEKLHIASNRIEYLIYDIKHNVLKSTKNSGSIYTMLIRRNGVLWAGAPGMILQYSDGNWMVERFPRDNYINTHVLYEDENQVLWVGCTRGLGIYKDGEVQINPFKKEILNTRVTDIAALQNKVLCIGTRGAGLLFIEGDSVHQVDVNDGLTSDNVERIYVDSNVIWLATNNGLNKVEFSSFSDWNYSIETFNVIDGLASNELMDVQKVDNRIWVSSNKGLTVMNPETIKKEKVAPPIWITGLRISERDTILTNHYDFAYDQNNLVISYVGLSYRDPGKLQYRYKMEGIDSVWEYTDNTSVKYTTLPYGVYNLQISASNRDGSWSQKPAILTFSISPPWWHTWWFRVLAGFVAIGAVALLIRFRENQVKDKAEAKATMARKIAGLELKALRAQMNPHFTFNTMNSIQHYITDKDTDSAQRYLSKFARLIRTILENSEKEQITIAKELEGLTLYMDLEVLRFEKAFTSEIIVGQDLEPEFDRIPPMLIQPYVENAIWHGLHSKDGTGKIRIELEKWGRNIKCTIEDNGIGREAAMAAKRQKESKHKSMGMHITKERLEILSDGDIEAAKVEIIDLKDKQDCAIGTRVEILIPIK